MYHRSIVTSDQNSKLRVHHIIFTFVTDNIRAQNKNIINNYYIDTYVELIRTIFIKRLSNDRRKNIFFCLSKNGENQSPNMELAFSYMYSNQVSLLLNLNTLLVTLQNPVVFDDG